MDLANGEHTLRFAPGAKPYDQNAIGSISQVVVVGTSADEVINTGDLTTEGFVFMRNLDLANFVNYGPESGGSMVTFGKIQAGEVAGYRIDPTVVLRAQADNAAVQLEVIILED